MAELQVTVAYKTVPGRVIFQVMCALFPVWAIMSPAALGFLIGRTLAHPELMPFATTVTGCVLLLAALAGGMTITALAEDNRIYVSKDGMSFPPYLLPKLKFHRSFSWAELTSVHILTKSDSRLREVNWILLGFNSGGCLPLNVRLMERADLEQVLLAIELWAGNCQRSPELIDYQMQIQNKGHGIEQVGYTQMWEEELSRRFQSTSFVPLEPGKQLQNGKFEIVRQLAFGGLSAIYLAQESHRDMVVLKEAVVPPGADEQTRVQAEQGLTREAEMLSKLNDESIARVLDHFVEDRRHYLVLEYINGQDLRQYVKQNGCLDQVMATEWGINILNILQILHSQSPPILHRDLTPENLVLSKDRIVLIDFGAANQFVGAATGTVVGKQAYIPPEQLRGKSVVESDIYALGGTLFFLLTGKDPMPLSVNHPRSINPEIDSKLDEVIAKCTAFEPEDRYRSAGEVAEHLKELVPNLQRQSNQVVLAQVKGS